MRDCRTALERGDRVLTCRRGHTFDVSRSGYVNLLQPQDRRSANPGDNAESVAARRRFVDGGFADRITSATADLLPLEARSIVVDVGCGEGAFLGELARRSEIDACGIDLSTAAIDLAARRHHRCTWIVANADRFVPLEDESVSALTSINARLNRDEFARVLRPDGRLLVAITAPDDLAEAREAMLGTAVERDRVERTVEMFAPVFELVHHERVSDRVRLDRNALIDAMSASYRGLRRAERERLSSIDALDVTLSRDVLLFRKSWS